MLMVGQWIPGFWGVTAIILIRSFNSPCSHIQNNNNNNSLSLFSFVHIIAINSLLLYTFFLLMLLLFLFIHCIELLSFNFVYHFVSLLRLPIMICLLYAMVFLAILIIICSHH